MFKEFIESLNVNKNAEQKQDNSLLEQELKKLENLFYSELQLIIPGAIGVDLFKEWVSDNLAIQLLFSYDEEDCALTVWAQHPISKTKSSLGISPFVQLGEQYSFLESQKAEVRFFIVTTLKKIVNAADKLWEHYEKDQIQESTLTCRRSNVSRELFFFESKII